MKAKFYFILFIPHYIKNIHKLHTFIIFFVKFTFFISTMKLEISHFVIGISFFNIYIKKKLYIYIFIA